MEYYRQIFTDDELLEILVQAEAKNTLGAISLIRHKTGFDLKSGAGLLIKIVKNELGKNVFSDEFCAKYKL